MHTSDLFIVFEQLGPEGYLGTRLGAVHDGVTTVYFKWIFIQLSQALFSVVILINRTNQIIFF